MEIMWGKHASFISASALSQRLSGYETIHIDLGTGDGRYVHNIAQTYPNGFAIGIDACRENLHEASRHGLPNVLFVIANALSLPPELDGLASHVTLNFPWGSLLEGLLSDDSPVLDGITSLVCPGAGLEVRLNGGALAEVGWSLEEGARQVRYVLNANGCAVRSPVAMTASDLRSFPTTWARRLAHGRDPRGVYLRGTW